MKNEVVLDMYETTWYKDMGVSIMSREAWKRPDPNEIPPRRDAVERHNPYAL
jgi:hypothetical protein